MIVFKNNKNQFGLISIILHWVVAVCMIGLLGLGWYLTQMTYYHPFYHRLFSFHKSLGLITLGIVLLTIMWFFSNKRPELPSSMLFIEKAFAHGMHILLLMLALLVPTTGYFMSTSTGNSVYIFGLEIPALLPRQYNSEILFTKLHTWLGYTTAILVALHVLAAFKHEFINKDGTIRRMLGRKV